MRTILDYKDALLGSTPEIYMLSHKNVHTTKKPHSRRQMYPRRPHKTEQLTTNIKDSTFSH